MSAVWSARNLPRLLMHVTVFCALASLAGGCLFPFPAAPIATAPTGEAPAPVTLPPSAGAALQTGAPTPAPTPGTPGEPTVALPAPGAPQTLTVWISEQVGPLAEGRAVDVLQQQFAAFEATHPGLTVDVLIKKAEGPGGIESLLTTASPVAPTMLPDLVALNTRTLDRLARTGLTVPLDALVSPAVQEDLYDLAKEAATIDDQWMGVQFQAKGLEHAVYNPNKIAVAPLTWTEVYSSGATYVFPAGGQEGLVNDAFLIQYLSTGALLVDEAGNPALDRDALAEVLGFYRQGIERGSILTDVIEFATVEQAWPMFLQAEVAISNISSDLYLSVKTGQAAAVPTRDGRAIILSRGHAWALTTRDPSRQPLVARLIEWLLNPVNMATWSQAAGTLPTRHAALVEMNRDPYVTFMYGQLETARPYPTSETHVRIYRAMQQAVDAVLREGVSPEIAAEAVLSAVNQETS